MLDFVLRAMVASLALAAIAAPVYAAATIRAVTENLVFKPGELSAKVGDTVEWTNNDIVAHTATAGNGDFDVMIPPKKTASFTLMKAGTVDYYCRFHPNMRASLKVEP